MTATKTSVPLLEELTISEIVNHKTYKPPEGYAIIYKHTCIDPTDKQVSFYIGSTSRSLKERCGSNFSGYTNNVRSNNKFTTFLRKYGSYSVKKSEILRIVRADLRDKTEQEEIQKHSSLDCGYNTHRVVKEVALPPKNYVTNTQDKSTRNNPTEISVENLQLTMPHRSEPTDYIIMNKGFHQHYFKNTVLGLHTPGMKGHISVPKNKEGIRSALRYLERDLGLNLKYGPDGCHIFTLDNIYLVGTKTSLRTFLDQNPHYIKKVSYLTFGEWDTNEG